MDGCDIYKNMDLWVKVHGYRNEKLSMTIFNSFLARCTEIHRLFLGFSKTVDGGFYFFYSLKNCHWRFLFKPHILVIYHRISYTSI